MKHTLTIEDLPQEVVGKMKETIRNDRQMIALQKKWDKAVRCHNYVEAGKLKTLMEEVEKRVINMYLQQYKGSAERLDGLMTAMSRQDLEDMNIYTNAVIFLCDMIETFSMESNAILQKYHPDHSIEMFRKITELGKEAKVHMRFMAKETDNLFQIGFADAADDITELILNKVRSFLRKQRRNEKKGYEKK